VPSGRQQAPSGGPGFDVDGFGVGLVVVVDVGLVLGVGCGAGVGFFSHCSQYSTGLPPLKKQSEQNSVVHSPVVSSQHGRRRSQSSHAVSGPAQSPRQRCSGTPEARHVWPKQHAPSSRWVSLPLLSRQLPPGQCGGGFHGFGEGFGFGAGPLLSSSTLAVQAELARLEIRRKTSTFMGRSMRRCSDPRTRVWCD